MWAESSLQHTGVLVEKYESSTQLLSHKLVVVVVNP